MNHFSAFTAIMKAARCLRSFALCVKWPNEKAAAKAAATPCVGEEADVGRRYPTVRFAVRFAVRFVKCGFAVPKAERLFTRRKAFAEKAASTLGIAISDR